MPCRRCARCRAGDYNLCADTVFAATPPWDGTLAKYYSVAGDYCYKVPEGVDMEEAALVEPVAVAVQVCKTAGDLANKTVLVFGCGPIGVLCQAVARAYGAAKVVGVDISQARLDFAREFAGSETVLNPRVEEKEGVEPIERAEMAAEILKEKLGLGEGADVVLECTGAEPCIQSGVYAARKGGTYVQAGMGKEVSACTTLPQDDADGDRMSCFPSQPLASERLTSRAPSDTRLASTRQPSLSWLLARSR